MGIGFVLSLVGAIFFVFGDVTGGLLSMILRF